MDTYETNLGTFGDYFWLEPLNLSAYRLAQDLGIFSAALSKILNGRNRMSDDVCWRLAGYFGVSMDYFVNIQAEYELRNQKDIFAEETKDLPVYNWNAMMRR